MIEVKNIEVILNQKEILSNISYRFEQGKLYAIIGPNGAGKTTFLKVLTGFLKPTKGKVCYLGKPLEIPNKDIAILWQNPYLFHTSVFNNIVYGLKIRSMAKKEIELKVNEILNKLHIEYLKEEKAQNLSGGEIAKVAIARAIIISPRILILDEPTANLDPQAILDIEKIIQELKVQKNITIIMVTHNLSQAKRLADETLLISKGTLVPALI